MIYYNAIDGESFFFLANMFKAASAYCYPSEIKDLRLNADIISLPNNQVSFKTI